MSRWMLGVGLGFLMLLNGCSTVAERPVRQVPIASVAPLDWPQALPADLYVPEGVAQPRVVVLIHGGGWARGSRQDGYMHRMREAVHAQGLAALMVSYRFAPQARFPAQVDDVAQALRWLARNGSNWGVTTDRVGVWGYSAGAHLASLVSLERTAVPVVGVVAGGIPADLTVWPRSPLVRDLMGTRRDDDVAGWTAASPAKRVQPGMPPHWLYHGRWDRLVPLNQATTMVDALKAAQVPVTLVERPGLGHILAAAWPGDSYDQAAAFLAEQLKTDQRGVATR